MVVRGSVGWAAVTVVAASMAVAGCGGGSDDQAATPIAPSGTASASAYSGGSSPSSSPTQQQPSAPASTSKAPADPLASPTIPPVVRGGQTPHPGLTSSAAPIRGTVSYTDGVRLQITGISQSTVKAHGPGQLSGPVSTFTLRMSNGSSRVLRLDQVVVTLVYGSPARTARPTYLQGSQDFAGPVRPGSTARATYSFAVPVAQRDRVVIHVDFDAVHAAAVFRGDAG